MGLARLDIFLETQDDKTKSSIISKRKTVVYKVKSDFKSESDCEEPLIMQEQLENELEDVTRKEEKFKEEELELKKDLLAE